MKIMLSLTFVTLYSVGIRLFFGFFNGFMSIMSITFLMFLPCLIGFLTVFFMPTEKVKQRHQAFLWPILTSVIILGFTMIFGIEGAICWVMMFPIFAVLAGIGGIIAFEMKKKKNGKKEEKELSDKINDSLNISFAIFIPLVFGFLEGEKTLIPETLTVKEELVFKSSPEVVWTELLALNQTNTTEKESFFIDLMGFPKHLNSSLNSQEVGGKRICNYERGLYFIETIQELKPHKKLVWKIDTEPLKIPASVMDEHILIGGKYFDIYQDTYEIEVVSKNEVRVTLACKFYINTPFNWYSQLWAKFLLGEVLQSELQSLRDKTKEEFLPNNSPRD